MKVMHLLKAEFANGVALGAAAGTATGARLFFLPGPWGGIGFTLMAVCGVGTAVALMRRTPWCADHAFWRTRPVSRRTMFLVKSLALLVLLVVPVMVVSAAALAGLGARTWWTGVGMLGGAALVAAGGLMAVLAAGSRDRARTALAWGLAVLPVILSAALMARLLEPLPADWNRWIAGALGTVFVLAGIVWLGWALVGWWHRRHLALACVGIASAALPWIHVGIFRTLGESATELGGVVPPTVHALIEVGGEGYLQPPLSVSGLPPGEFATPNRLWIRGPKTPRGRTIFDGTMRGGYGSGYLGPTDLVDVFSDDHREFAAVMDLERVWAQVREQVPEHEAWVPSDPGPRRPGTWISLPDPEQFEDPGLTACLSGERFRFHGIEPVKPVKPRRLDAPVGKLELKSASVPSAGAIDVRLHWMQPEGDPWIFDRRLSSADPPEVWAVLFHEPSRTAYGTASLREGFGRNAGPAGFLIRRTDLVLHFQLPELETALLGLDARRVLEESALYLFLPLRTGSVEAILEP